MFFLCVGKGAVTELDYVREEMTSSLNWGYACHL